MIPMSNSFITNKDKFLSDIINGILPKTNAVDFLVGYFYYSGYKELSEQLNKESRILSPIQISIIASVLRPNVPNTPIFSVDQPPN